MKHNSTTRASAVGQPRGAVRRKAATGAIAAVAILAMALAGCSSTDTSNAAHTGITPVSTSHEGGNTGSSTTDDTTPATSSDASSTDSTSASDGTSVNGSGSSLSDTSTSVSGTAGSTAGKSGTHSPKPGSKSTGKPGTHTSTPASKPQSNKPPANKPNRPATTPAGSPAGPSVSYKTFTQNVTIPQPATQHVNDSSLAKGKSKTVQSGHSGTKQVTYRQKYVNGTKSGSATVVGSKTTKSAVATIIHVGTKVAAPKVTYKTYTKTSTIAKPKAKHVNDSSLYVGEHKTVAGHTGVKTTTYRQKYVNGTKSGSATVVGSKTTKSAVADVIHDGTKPKPAPHWIYDGGIAQQTASLVNQYRTSKGGSSLSASASKSMTPDTAMALHAWGYTSASGAVNAWIASPEHQQGMMVVWASSVVCGAWHMSDNSKGPFIGCDLV